MYSDLYFFCLLTTCTEFLMLFVVITVMIYHDLSVFLQCCVVMNSCERILCNDSAFPQLLEDMELNNMCWNSFIYWQIMFEICGEKIECPFAIDTWFFKGDCFLGKRLGIRPKKSILLQNSFLHHTTIYHVLNAIISIIGPLYQSIAEMVDVSIWLAIGCSATFISVRSSLVFCCQSSAENLVSVIVGKALYHFFPVRHG